MTSSDSSGGIPAFDFGIEQFADDQAVTAPYPVLFGTIVACVVGLLLFVPGSKTLNVIGYVVGAIVVPATVVLFRSLKRQRQRSSLFVDDPRWAMVPMVLLLIGILIAVVHAFFWAKHVEIVQ